MTPSKTELKAYLSTLKSVAKSKGNAYKYVNIGENAISATDGEAVFTLSTGVNKVGTCDLKALTSYEFDQSLDLSDFSIDEDWVNTQELEWEMTIGLGENLKRPLLTAFEVVSKDDFRRVLQNVAIKDGYIIGTDGYRAYFKEIGKEILTTDFYISPLLMTAFKKLSKYGNWEIRLYKDGTGRKIVRLTNGYLEMTTPVDEADYPEMVDVVNRGAQEYDTLVELPLKDLGKFAEKGSSVIIEDDMTLTLENSRGVSYLRPPLKARVSGVKVEVSTTERLVICPIRNNEEKLELSVDMLKPFIDKDGWCRLYWCKGSYAFLNRVM